MNKKMSKFGHNYSFNNCDLTLYLHGSLAAIDYTFPIVIYHFIEIQFCHFIQIKRQSS